MARRICRGPRNPLVLHRTKNAYGPLFQRNTSTSCIKGPGNYYAPGMPGSGPQAYYGVVFTANQVEITWTRCIDVLEPDFTGIEVRYDGGGWTQVVGHNQVSDTVVRFAVPTIDPGVVVEWRYVGGSNTIVDCAVPPEDVGDQQVAVENPLVLEGFFMLLETGGTDIMLLEDDTDGTNGQLNEEAT